ncbi:MAG: hypothetical protein K0V04_09925, partial [Deltaproteobacteria bacterium]|nr:hypothetical protein [Deltaproteobacteria bacterium]
MTNNAHTHDDEPDEQTLDGHRAQFPGLAAGRSRTYLNFGARGLMPSAAIESIHRGLETLQVVGPASRAGQAWVDYEVRTTREVLAELLSCDPSSVAMVNNVSTACALAIWGTPWRPG